MIISRTPYRISFFGGGTDYPVWYRSNPGKVLAVSIDKYCYITCRYLPPFFEHNSRIIYSKIETINSPDEIQHPSVRACLKFLKIQEGVEIHHDGDLPARTGIGSSSAFTVGLLHGLYALRQRMPTKTQLAKDAIHVEQNILKENVGCQDQVLSAFGGLSRVDFARDDSFALTPVILKPERLNELQDHLLLYFTGFSRIASEIAKEQIERTKDKKTELQTMAQMVDEALNILGSGSTLDEFGRLLHKSWQLKKTLNSKITTPEIDAIYEEARRAGVLGGKILGAGGGGFMLFFAPPSRHKKIKEALKSLLRVSFRFENIGSQIIFHHPDLMPEDLNRFNAENKAVVRKVQSVASKIKSGW